MCDFQALQVRIFNILPVLFVGMKLIAKYGFDWITIFNRIVFLSGAVFMDLWIDTVKE